MAVFEIALSEWGIDHVYIFKNWTWAQLLRYIDVGIERRNQQAEALNPDKPKKIGTTEFLGMMGGKIGTVFRKKETDDG